MRVDYQRLSELVRAKRAGRSYRVTERETGGVSASTLCRVENGTAAVGFRTIRQLCTWTGIRPEDLILDPAESEDELDTPTQIETLLREDPLLDAQDARAIAQVVRLAYATAVRHTLSGGDED